MTGDYLIVGEGRDGMYYTPEMSRRARIVELWATLKYLGRKGIDEMIYGFQERAKQFASVLTLMDGFEVMNEVVFNQVLVQCVTDELTEKVIEEIQRLGVCWFGGSSWKGRKVIRISVCSWAITDKDIRQTVQAMQNATILVKK